MAPADFDDVIRNSPTRTSDVIIVLAPLLLLPGLMIHPTLCLIAAVFIDKSKTSASFLADAHFPVSSLCRHGPREIRADGHNIPILLEAILQLLPLDTYVDAPVALMQRVPADQERDLQVWVWPIYQDLVNKAEGRKIEMEYVERFAFYERAKKAFAIVATGETAQYGNIILKKGCVLQ